MDILKKMFGKGKEDKADDKLKDEFRKPSWFEEYESDDDELFDGNKKFVFEIFTNPLELQRHFDQQMQEILKSIREYEENGENLNRNLKDEYLKPGFEDQIMKEFKKSMIIDTDLDGEIHSDQLHSLLQRFSPDLKSTIHDKENKKKIQNLRPSLQRKPKLSDEEIIMAKIHGTLETDENNTKSPIRRRDILKPKIPPHFGGVFEGTYQGPKIFRQSIMTQTVRKPDGSYETKKIIRDPDGNIKTTITRTVDGKTETITTYGKDGQQQISPNILQQDANKTDSIPSVTSTDRNIYVSKDGYALPKNLW